MRSMVQLEGAFLTTETMQAVQEWASTNRADLSQALEILLRRQLGMTAELPKPKILGESKDVSFAEMCRALGLDQQQAFSQWSRMAPNEFCNAVNEQAEYAGLAIEYDPVCTHDKKFRLHCFSFAPAGSAKA